MTDEETAVNKTMNFRIAGMTCVNCRNRIEKALRNKSGVESADVNYQDGTAAVTCNPKLVTPKEIYAVVESLGYRAPGENGGAVPKAADTGFKIAGTLIIIFALFMIMRQFGAGGLANAFPLAEAGMGYGMIFLVGLVTSVHCVVMCGGINLSQTLGGGLGAEDLPLRVKSFVSGKAEAGGAFPPSKFTVLVPSIFYNGGRLISYTVVGAAAGALGSVISLTGAMRGMVQLIAGVFMVIMGINMLGFFPGLRKFIPRMPRFFARAVETEKERGKSPLIVGLLNGLMPCGPLQAMQLYALSTGSPVGGAVAMFLFSAGTVPLMFFIGALSSILSRRFAAVLTRAGAVLVAALGLTMFSNGLSLSGFSPDSINPMRAFMRPEVYNRQNAAAASSEPVIRNGVQIVNSTLSSGRYPAITVQEGIPVRWVINAPAGSINGCNNRMIIREYGVEHQFQTGDNIIEFTPAKTGRFPYSCWMGMIRSSITVVAEGSTADTAGARKQALDPAPAGVAISTDNIVLAEIQESGRQMVTVNLRDDGIAPAVIVLQRGVPAAWVINNDSLDPGNSSLVFPSYYSRFDMEQGDNVIQLIPADDFDFSTGDNMFYGYVKVVDDLDTVDIDSIKTEVSEYETMIYPEAYFKE
jgi:sulfite exporter TauE/SafE/copper chaperone CopZ/plastocyanin domain-containing protein